MATGAVARATPSANFSDHCQFRRFKTRNRSSREPVFRLGRGMKRWCLHSKLYGPSASRHRLGGQKPACRCSTADAALNIPGALGISIFRELRHPVMLRMWGGDGLAQRVS